MFRIASFLGLLGLFAATAVIAWSGYEEVLTALGHAGFGIIWASLFHVVSLFACVMGWHALLPGKVKVSKLFFLYLIWVRASVNNLMPVAKIGGEIVSVRLMIKKGMRKAPSIACTVVETTLSILAQFAFVLLGVLLLLRHVSDDNTSQQLLIGLVVSAPAIAGLIWIQKVGLFGLFDRLFHMMFRDKWKTFAGSGKRLDLAVRTMYKRSGKAFYCFIWQFISWALRSIEIWLALYFLGNPLPLLDCLIIEALIQATSSAAFMVPGALGVQEASFILFGGMLGLDKEMAAALAVIRRCRDLFLYVPGLIVWQIQEGRWLMRDRKS